LVSLRFIVLAVSGRIAALYRLSAIGRNSFFCTVPFWLTKPSGSDMAFLTRAIVTAIDCFGV